MPEPKVVAYKLPDNGDIIRVAVLKSYLDEIENAIGENSDLLSLIFLEEHVNSDWGYSPNGEDFDFIDRLAYRAISVFTPSPKEIEQAAKLFVVMADAVIADSNQMPSSGCLFSI